MNIVDKLNPEDWQALTYHVQQIWGSSVDPITTQETEVFLPILRELESVLESQGFDTSVVEVWLATGCNTSNGHAFLHEGRGVAWLSASNYPSDNARQLFGLHEILHAIHYANAPAYGFTGQEQKNHNGRQLVTEGLATYATQQLLGCTDNQALWADYITEDEVEALMLRYRDARQRTASRMLDRWEEHGDSFFYANDPSDVDTYRSGYALGLWAMQRYVEATGTTVRDLLRMDRRELDAAIKDLLKTA